LTLSFWEKIRRKYLRRAPRYTTNFEKTTNGNGIPHGKELLIRVKDAEAVTGRLYDAKTHKTYQLDQSHARDEDNDVETTNFTMKSKVHPNTSPPDHFLPRGKYVIFTWWWDDDTMRGGTYKDEFVIF